MLQPVFKGAASLAVAQKIDMELELKWDENEKDGLRLQAWSPQQSPVNRHPSTGLPAWSSRCIFGAKMPSLSFFP